MEMIREAFGSSPAAEGAPQVQPVGSPHGLAGGWNFDDQYVYTMELDQLGAAGKGRPRTVRDDSLDAAGIGRCTLVAGTRPGHLAVVLHSHQKPSGLCAGPVGQANDGFDQGTVAQR